MINQILEQLSNEPSTNKKIDILKNNQGNELLSKVFYAALNPSLNYYIKKIPEYENLSNNLTLSESLEQLNKLSDRTYTGHNGIRHLEHILNGSTNDDAEVIKKIINRDLKCGVSSTTVNKVFKNLIPDFPYMRCSLLSKVDIKKWDWKNGIYSQLKSDGMFANIIHDLDGNVTIMSRNGTFFPLESFGDIVGTIKEYFDRGYCLHGELLVKRNGKILERSIGNGSLNSIAKGGKLDDGDIINYHVWDIISTDGFVAKNTYNQRYADRFDDLLEQCNRIKPLLEDIDNRCIEIIETKIVYSFNEALEHYQEQLSKGLEGTIIKNPNGFWKSSTSKDLVKLKLDVVVDLEIIGFKDGNGKHAETFGSIVCKSSDGKLIVNVSGFSDEYRKNISDNREEYIGKIIAVKSNNIMHPSDNNANYSLFLPRLAEIRNDKDTADDIDMIIAQFENAISGK
jgi:DNA ligase-1